MGELSDHQDSNLFSYDRSWGEIEDMLDRAERKMNSHKTAAYSSLKKEDKLYHIRNYKALQGVVQALRWVLGDLTIDDPLE